MRTFRHILVLSLTRIIDIESFPADIYAGIFDPKRSGSKGFHEGIFDDGFGGFSTLRKRSGSKGFHEGIFDDGFGGFETYRKRNLRNLAAKRRPEMDSRGIDGDAFTGDA